MTALDQFSINEKRRQSDHDRWVDTLSPIAALGAYQQLKAQPHHKDKDPTQRWIRHRIAALGRRCSAIALETSKLQDQ